MNTQKKLQMGIMVLILVCAASFSSIAGKPEIPYATNVHKTLKESVKFPDLALKSGCCGTVDVLFFVDTDGKIEIRSITGADKSLEKGVKEQLEKLRVNDPKPVVKEQFYVRFTFKLV